MYQSVTDVMQRLKFSWPWEVENEANWLGPTEFFDT